MWWLKSFLTSAALLVLVAMSAAADEVCIDRQNLALLNKPGEPPVCPTPISEFVPSAIGRPQNYTAIELAACAGLWDAVVALEPSVSEDPSFKDPDKLLGLAKAQRERPPLSELVQWRQDAKKDYLDLLQDPDWQHSSVIPHAFSACNGALY